MWTEYYSTDDSLCKTAPARAAINDAVMAGACTRPKEGWGYCRLAGKVLVFTQLTRFHEDDPIGHNSNTGFYLDYALPPAPRPAG